MMNKHNIEILKETRIKYYHNLIKDFFKILPIYEGRDVRTKLIVYTAEESYNQYKKYIYNFTVEICGAYNNFHEDLCFLKLSNILEGMSNLNIDNHANLRSLVFHCIDICKKMIDTLEGDGVNVL